MTNICVIVLTYKSDFNKIIETLKSILNQKFVKFEVVISEDSENNEFYCGIEKYFFENNFKDYTFVYNQKNVGTVKNLCNALRSTTAKIIKPISPGDMLYSESSLYEYYKYTSVVDVEASFGNPLCYMEVKNKKKYIDIRMPNDVIPYIKENNYKLLTNILLKNDWIYGATIAYKRETLQKFIEIILERIIYCEDTIIPLMIMENKKIAYINKYLVEYEYHAGVTFNEREYMKLDQLELCKIVHEKYKKFSPIILRREKWIHSAKGIKIIRIIKEVFIVPEYIMFRIKYKCLPKRRIKQHDDK